MKYAFPPSTISFKEATIKGHCLAPSKFAKFTPIIHDNVQYEQLDTLITTSEEREDIKANRNYYYIEIGDIDTNWGRIDYHNKLGFIVPKRPLKVKTGDILVSKVRTYRKGIGYVDKDSDNLTCTPAFLLIRSVRDRITKEYLYAILRHDIFSEQIMALQNRGSYPRLDKHVKQEVLIPIPKDNNIIEYITCLMRAIINKNQEISNKFSKMQEIITQEISNCQKTSNFTYTPPTYQELKREKRLDSGIYGEEYKRILHLINNYAFGSFLVPKEKFKSGSTPTNRIIGIGKKNWVTPTIVSDYGYFEKEEKIICNIFNIKKDCTMIINRTFKGGLGEYVGISAFYDFSEKGVGQHNQGIYRIEDYPEEQLKLIAILLNSRLYRKLCGHISLGSKMREIKISNFSRIPFPILRTEVTQQLVEYYSQETKYPSNITLQNFGFVDYDVTKTSGILDLSYQINKIDSQIKDTIDSLVKGKRVELSLDFLATDPVKVRL